MFTRNIRCISSAVVSRQYRRYVTTEPNQEIVKGIIGEVFSEEGKPYKVSLEEGKHYSWCPCGQSKKKPFCDGTHKEFNQKSEQKYKPIRFKIEKTKHYWICNCRKTKNIPFCDGSHKQKSSAETS